MVEKIESRRDTRDGLTARFNKQREIKEMSGI